MDRGRIKQLARELRKNQTETERIFWELVRNRRFKGYKFTRQYPFRYEYNGIKKFFIVDFFCAEKKLVVEIDGGIHLQQREYDEVRSQILKSQYKVHILRFDNKEFDDIETVKQKLEKYLS